MLVRRQLSQIPLISVFVLIVHLVVNGTFQISKGLPSENLNRQFIPRVVIEDLLRCIVPEGFSAGHGLPKLTVFQQIDKLDAGILCSLVVMDNYLPVQRFAILQNSVGIQTASGIPRYFSSNPCEYYRISSTNTCVSDIFYV